MFQREDQKKRTWMVGEPSNNDDGLLQDGVQSINTPNMHIFNTQARRLYNIAAHDIRMAE
jgi:hypothetical protein